MVFIKAKAIVPNMALAQKNVQLFNFMLKAAVNRVADDIRKEFLSTTKTWEKKPQFKRLQKTIGNVYSVTIFTENEIYGYVVKGTKPHIIRAKNAPALLFSYPSTPKTQPMLLGSGKGSRGSQWAQKLEVHHPGTEARDFDIVIAARAKKRIQIEAKVAVANFAKAMNNLGSK